MADHRRIDRIQPPGSGRHFLTHIGMDRLFKTFLAVKIDCFTRHNIKIPMQILATYFSKLDFEFKFNIFVETTLN
jgi:hypothetical protein